jgi:electron transfer flavoprotein beta subunit
LNPYDEFAVEEALQIKEREGDSEITVLCLGPDRAVSAIRTALAMGADNAVHLKVDDTYLDSFAVSTALSSVLKEMEFDLLLMGKQAVDDDNCQIGPRVATLLDIPCVSVVTELELSDGAVVAEREVEGGVEVIEAKLPAIVTCQKGLNEPRYASLKGIMMAKKKPIEEKSVDVPEAKISIGKMEYPPAREAGKIVGEGVEAVPELVRLLHEEAKVI